MRTKRRTLDATDVVARQRLGESDLLEATKCQGASFPDLLTVKGADIRAMRGRALVHGGDELRGGLKSGKTLC